MKNTGAPIRDFDRWICLLAKFSEECVKLLLFCGGEGEHPPSGEFGIGMKLYGMVPCLARGEMGKGFFGEDICEVFVVLWNGGLRQMDLLGLSLFCESL